MYIFDQIVQVKDLFLKSTASAQQATQAAANGLPVPKVKQWVLQQAVQSMALIGGRKFGLRVHAFVVVWPSTPGSLEPEPEPEPASSSGG